MQLIDEYPISLPPNEKELIKRFKAGDEAAFREIYDLLHKEIRGYYYKNYNNGNELDADDIIAEAFYRLFKYRGGMEGYIHIRRTIFKYVKNLCIDRFRFNKRTYEFFNAQPEEGIYNENHLFETELLHILIYSELIKLKKLMRGKVLHLMFFEQKSTWEITEILGISRQTVLNHKTRALQAIKDRMQGVNIETKNIKEEIHQLFMVFQG